MTTIKKTVCRTYTVKDGFYKVCFEYETELNDEGDAGIMYAKIGEELDKEISAEKQKLKDNGLI